MRKSILFGLNTHAAATHVLALLIVAGGFGTARASKIAIKCSGGVVTASVSGGECKKDTARPAPTVACTNSAGSSAGGYCASDGTPTCGNSKGSGECTITRRVPTRPTRPPIVVAPPADLSVYTTLGKSGHRAPH